MIPKGLLYPVLILVIVTGLCGCRDVGPQSIPVDRFNYGTSISESWKRQTLLNMVKIRYADTPIFMDVGQVVASYEVSSSVAASGAFRRENGKFPFDSLGVSGSGLYANRPTVTYSPLTGQSFIRGLMTPIRPESVLLIIQSGWAIDRVLATTAKSINGLQNQTYSVNGGVKADDRFLKVVELLRTLQLSDLVEFRIAPKQKDSDDLTFMVTFRDKDVSERTAQDIAELRTLLKLNPDVREYKLVWGGMPADNNEIAIQTRSVLQVLAVVSLQAQVPENHIREGRATPSACILTDDSEGAVKIRSSQEPPDDAYSAVPYEGYWFWIDDKDLQSKQTFSFLMLLFSLVESGGQPAPPIITIPVR